MSLQVLSYRGKIVDFDVKFEKLRINRFLTMEAKGRSNKFLYILLTTLIVLVIAGLTTGLVIYFKSSDSDAEVKQDQPKEKK